MKLTNHFDTFYYSFKQNSNKIQCEYDFHN